MGPPTAHHTCKKTPPISIDPNCYETPTPDTMSVTELSLLVDPIVENMKCEVTINYTNVGQY